MNANDDAIARAVIYELGKQDELSSTTIAVDVRDGVVRLVGAVNTIGDRHSAEAAVARAPGVKAVIDELRVGR